MFGYATFAEVTFAEGERREGAAATIVTAVFSSSVAATVAFSNSTPASTSTILQRHHGAGPHYSRKRFLEEVWPLIQAAEQRAKELERLKLREAKRREREEKRREEERAAIAAAEALSEAYAAILTALDEQRGDESEEWLSEARERLGIVEETISKASPLVARSAIIAKTQSAVAQERSARLAKFLADAAIKRAQISAKRQSIKDQFWLLQNQDDEDEAIALLLLH